MNGALKNVVSSTHRAMAFGDSTQYLKNKANKIHAHILRYYLIFCYLFRENIVCIILDS